MAILKEILINYKESSTDIDLHFLITTSATRYRVYDNFSSTFIERASILSQNILYIENVVLKQMIQKIEVFMFANLLVVLEYSAINSF